MALKDEFAAIRFVEFSMFLLDRGFFAQMTRNHRNEYSELGCGRRTTRQSQEFAHQGLLRSRTISTRGGTEKVGMVHSHGKKGG